MTRKPLMVAATLSTGLLFYAGFVTMMMSRVTSWIGTLTSSPKPSPWIANGSLWFLGWWIPLRLVVVVASIAPIWLILHEVFRRVRRRNRELLGQCLDCGYLLPTGRGRCPGCGLRYERGRVRGESLFPVIGRRRRV